MTEATDAFEEMFPGYAGGASDPKSKNYGAYQARLKEELAEARSAAEKLPLLVKLAKAIVRRQGLAGAAGEQVDDATGAGSLIGAGLIDTLEPLLINRKDLEIVAASFAKADAVQFFPRIEGRMTLAGHHSIVPTGNIASVEWIIDARGRHYTTIQFATRRTPPDPYLFIPMAIRRRLGLTLTHMPTDGGSQ